MDQISSIDSAISTSKSASRKQTSMSSFSLESGVCATSTSGCSSLVDAKRQKTLKKQRVKQCLEELRSLVKPPKGREKCGGGTLTTLQNVISQMKKYQDVGETASNAPDTVDSELMGSAQDGDGIHWQLSCNHNVERADWFKVVMAMKENNVLQVPHDLLRMLRYPNNYWFNQSLMDYIYKRDIVTVNTHLNMVRSQSKQAAASSGSESTNTTEQKNIFFFRIRHYKSIRHGFSLNRSEKYSVFCGQASRQKVQLNFPPGTPVEGLQADHIYPVLECTQMQSAYTSPGMLPAQNTFLMRHSLHCNYIFLHPSSIPLTGYLPQEVIGTSIFDYYHPQDLLILLGIYQQIVATPGKTFQSIPYRMRVKNGDYIRLETEWSSFVNPWTSRIDFIIAKHHVVQGPTNLDIFNECPSSKRQPLEVSPQARSLQRHIKSAMMQQMDTSSSRQPRCRQVNRSSSRQPRWRQVNRSSSDQPRCRTPLQPPSEPAALPAAPVCPPPQPEKVEACPEPSPPEATKQEEPDDGKPNANVLENEKLLIYEQLNYAQNIRRFLLSCAASLGGKSSSENTDSDASDQEDIGEITVDLSLPKPPSFASSTKALVSEREQLEEMPPSPTHEDLPELSSTTSTDDDVYQPIPLTEEVITLHNRQQRQEYIEKMVREKTNLVSVQGQGLRIIKETMTAKKRSHTKDIEDSPKASRMDMHGKWSQTDPAQLLYAKMPMEEERTPPGSPKSPKIGNPNPFASKLPHQQPGTIVSVSAPNYVTVNNMSNMGSNMMLCQPMTHPGSKPQLVTVENARGRQQQHLMYNNPVPSNANPMQMAQWPYYGTQNMQTSGMSYVPQIVYQPIPGSYFPPVTAQPMLGQSLSVAPAAPQGSPIKQSRSDIEDYSSLESKENQKDEEGKMAEKKSVEGSDSQWAEDTSSSMMYLLDSGNNSSSLDESDDQQNKMVTHPMNMMPPWKCNILWSTALEMNFKMPSMNTQQVLKNDRLFLQKMRQPPKAMQQVQELIDQSPSAECVLLDDDNLLGSSAKSTDLKTNTGDLEQREEDQEPIAASPSSEHEAVGIPNSPPREKSEKMGSDSDSSDEGISKGSSEAPESDLTPSDQRSHDDQPSSAKESDMASSSDSGQSPIPKDDSLKTILACKDLMANVFVPMQFEKQTLSKSAWLKDTAFDSQVQMQYNKPQAASVGDVLANDQAQLNSMDQPEMVHDQLDELMVQLKSHIMQSLTPIGLDQDDMEYDPEGASDWGSNAQSSFDSYHSEGKVFPYSCAGSDGTNTDVCTNRVPGDLANRRKLVSESDKSDCSSEQAAVGAHQSDCVRDSAADQAAPPLGAMQDAPQGGGQSSQVAHTASAPVGRQLLTDTQTVDIKSGGEARPAGRTGSHENVQSDVGRSDVSLPLVSSCSGSQHGADSVYSEPSAHSAASVPSCCSPKVIIAQMKTSPNEVTADGTSEQRADTSGKESAVLMMKDLFTCDEELMGIP